MDIWPIVKKRNITQKGKPLWNHGSDKNIKPGFANSVLVFGQSKEVSAFSVCFCSNFSFTWACVSASGYNKKFMYAPSPSWLKSVSV